MACAKSKLMGDSRDAATRHSNCCRLMALRVSTYKTEEL